MTPDAPAGGTVTCPDCGREQPAEQQLCDCGYPLEFQRRREPAEEVRSVTRAPGEEDDDTAELPPVVVPGPVSAPPASLQPPGPVVASRDVVCPSCGEGNDPARTWCGRCGTRLRREVAPPPPPPPPPARRSTGPLLAAGIAAVVLALVAVLGVVVWQVRDDGEPQVPPAASPTTPPEPQRLPVERVTDARATSTLPPAGPTTYDVTNTLDGRVDTAWNHHGSEDTGIDPEGVQLTYTFDAPVHVVGLVVVNGYNRIGPTGRDLFTSNSRVAQVRVEGDGGAVQTTMADSREEQVVPADIGTTSTVTITIVTTYRGQPWRDVALSEVGFLVRP